ncbi:ceramidase domain-containing protein [Aureimonas sp. AU12]|uniref:ceramidase domain-containing protein n=1 Tax=Aureimonas sp. AU12 TaxID=1638161 RepID=UPI000783A278|nr:ceramidase domain-containing protein [Aureimonas sp. AU12]
MDWFAPIDAYCERTSGAFWAEPVNALSNVAFLVAAALAFRLWRRRAKIEGGDRATLALIALVAVIGIGSFLFHTFADQWSVLADVIPIAIFIYGYFALALRRFVELGRGASALGTLAFALGGQALAPLAEPWMGSSAAYIPALAALFGLGTLLTARGHPAARALLGAGGVFAVSLTLRTLDSPLCAAVPLGLHFLWHVLNATVLGILLVGAIHAPRRA